jgi:hypothetical protein
MQRPGGLFGFFFGQQPFGGSYDARPRRIDPDYPSTNRGLY